MKLKNTYKYFLIALTAVAITVAAVLTKCPVYRLVPLYVSLLVMYLQTRVSRFSFLLGGCNAAYYAVVYYALELYGMALYSIFVACPIQIVTYIRWRKNTRSNETVLKRMTGKQRILGGLAFCAGWAVLYFALRAFGSEYLILDNTATLIGVTANVASLLYLIEFPYIQCVTYIVNIALNIQMVQNDARQWTFLIYSIYAFICVIISAVFMQKQYDRQHKEIKA